MKISLLNSKKTEDLIIHLVITMKELGNPYDFDSKFSKYRDTYNQNDFGQQWKDTRLKMRTRSNRGISNRLVIIVLILVFAFLYVIDFDLSLFKG